MTDVSAAATTPGPAGGRRVGLLCVDVQNDFCEGGALPVDGGAAVAQRLADHLADHRDDYALVVASRDWHIDPGRHWSTRPDYILSWPVHCRAGSDGAQLHPSFAPAVATGLVDAVVDKGQYADGYSAFEGRDEQGRDLATLLAGAGVTEVVVVGLATDHCVRATALDARATGLRVTVATDLCAGVAPEPTRAALDTLRAAGVTVD